MNLGDFDYYFIEKEFYYINVNRKNVCNITSWQWQVVIGERRQEWCYKEEEFVDTIFSQNNLDSKLLIIDKKVILMVS